MPKYWAWLVDPRDVRRTSRASLLDIMQPLYHVSCHLGRNLHRLSEVHAVISQYFLTSDPPHAQTGCGLYPSLPSFLHPPSPYTFSPGIRIANVWLSAFLYRPSPLTPIHSMGWCGRERVHVSAGGATAQRPFATKLVTGQYPSLHVTRRRRIYGLSRTNDAYCWHQPLMHFLKSDSNIPTFGEHCPNERRVGRLQSSDNCSPLQRNSPDDP